MLTHPTLDQMHQLGLAGMARAFTELEANPQSADLAHAEWLALLLDREATERYDRRLRARLRYARLRHQAAVEDVDYRAARGLDRALFQALTAGRWIEEAQNLIIEGPAGVGKSWLACALGHKACRDNRSVLYQRAPRMFGDLALARGDGRYPRLMRALGVEPQAFLDRRRNLHGPARARSGGLCVSSGSPGSPRRTAAGSPPRTRIATLFQLFCPCQTAPYPAARIAAAGNFSSGAVSSCRQTMSGAVSASHATRLASRSTSCVHVIAELACINGRSGLRVSKYT